MKAQKAGFISVGVLFIYLSATLPFAGAGNLEPDGPPTAGTMKRLDEVEPRVSIQSLPGTKFYSHGISEPGSYYAAGNITSLIKGAGIYVGASDVTIDLMGFVLTSQNGTNGISLGEGVKNVTIRNGHIINWTAKGIDASEASGVHCRDVHVESAGEEGFLLGMGCSVAGCSTVGCSDGFSLGAGGIITGCIARNNSGRGFHSVATDGLKIVDSTAADNGAEGIRVGRGSHVTGCTAIGNGAKGIFANSHSRVADNALYDNNDGLVLVSKGYPFLFNAEPTISDSFYMDKYETTNAAYCEFLNDTATSSLHWTEDMEINRITIGRTLRYEVEAGRENHPVTWVSLIDARAFAEWRSKAEGRSYRVPRRIEWSKAGSWDPIEEKHYLYGFGSDTVDATQCNYDNNVGGTTEVGHYNGSGGTSDAKSYYGCYDMSGNVAEWVDTICFEEYYYIFGGNWTVSDMFCRVGTGSYGVVTSRSNLTGFRLIAYAD